MVQIVAVNGLGYAVPLNFPVIGSPIQLATPVYRGLYEWFMGDITVLNKSDEEESTYQLPMPEFGV